MRGRARKPDTNEVWELTLTGHKLHIVAVYGSTASPSAIP